MKDPREGSPFFPGEMAIRHPHLLYADLISPTISFNPPVAVQPRKVSPTKKGRFVMEGKDVTNHYAFYPVISAGAYDPLTGKTSDGKPELHVNATKANASQIRGHEDNKGDYMKLGNLWRINMFRRTAGFKVLKNGKPIKNQPEYIVSAETGGKHYYALTTIKAFYGILANFPSKKSEPRLRIETRGVMTKTEAAESPPEPLADKSLSVRGKVHPLYDSFWISPLHEYMDWLKNPTPLSDLLPPQLIISISGPSGMGKSSVQKELKKLFGKKASIAPTYTTRGKRVNEKQGIDIKTVTDAKFEKMRESGEFTAPNGTELVFENYGGKKYARRVSDLTATPIVIIDQSFKALERMREAEIAPVFSVFLLLDRPREEWEKIIRSRKEPEKIVQQRIKSGRRMMREFKNHNFDLAVKNRKGKLKQTASKIHSEILTSQAKTNPPEVIPEYLYHVTAEENLNSILQEGLKPKVGALTKHAFQTKKHYDEKIGGPVVWGTTENKAGVYASMVQPFSLWKNNAILAINTEGLDFQYYSYEEYFTRKEVPPSHIRLMYYMDGELAEYPSWDDTREMWAEKIAKAKTNPPKKITPGYVRKNQNTLFVFGDNDLREGKGGQAAIRDEPNAMGLRTKKKPKTTEDSYYSDEEYESNIRKMSNDVNKIKEASKQYQSIYYIPGIGEGRAKLKQKAPKTYRWLKNKLDELNRVHVVIDGSPQKDKKLRAVFTFPDGRKQTTHFGAKHYNDYTIHNDKRRRADYLRRHGKREDWEDFTTAGALSKWILWNKKTVKASFDHFLAVFSLTGELKVKTSQAGKIKHFNKKYDTVKNPPMDCPPATQDLELNTKNRNSAIKTDYIRYGPLNLSDEKYYEDAAEHWNTDVATAKKSKCSNCVAFDISPRMLDCMPGPVSQDIEDEDGYLGYCWMHHFKCHSARTCFTWAAGGPIDEDDVSYEWQERSGIKTNPPSVTPEGRKIPKRYLKGLNKEEMIIAAKEIDKGYKYDIDDPKAYEFWKSDIKAQARGYKPVPSQYKKKFIEMYGPLPEKGDFLSKVSKATGVKKSILEEVMDRGLAAWRGGHAAATVQHQWATGRVYSFVTLGDTVMKDGRRMSDYKLAEEAGIIPDELKIPKKNPLQQTMSGKAIQMEKPATGRKVFYIPEEEDWYIVTVGYTSQKAAKDDMKEFEKIAKNHIKGDFKIVNKKKYNYAVRKGTKIPSGLNPRTGGPKLQQQAIQTRKSDEGETIFGGDPLLGESWKSNPPHQVQLNADGSTKAIANQIRREMQASGISVIQNAAMTPNSTYIELLPSEGQFDITVVAPSSSNKSLLLMDQVALFLSDDTGLDIATLNSDEKTALGNRLSFQSSSENGAIGILVNEELSTHDYYIKIAEAVTKAFRAKENPPEGTTVMTFNIRIPIKFEDTLDAFIKLEKRGYSWKNENFKNMWFTMHTPYGEKTSIHMQQSQTYLYNAHKMSEKEQEKVIEDLKAAGGVMKRKPRSVSRDHLPQNSLKALQRKNKEGIKERFPPEIYEELQQGNTEQAHKWINENKGKKPQQQQQKPQQQQQKPQQQQQTRTSGQKKKVKQVESNLSKNLIKSLSGRKHPQTEKEKEASRQNQKKKKKNPLKKYKTNPGLDNDAIYYLEDFGKAMTDAEAKRKFKSEKLRGPIGSEELFLQLAEKVQDFGEASGWIKDGRLYFRKGKKTVNEAMVTGYILEGATAFFHTHPRAWEPSQTSPDDFKVYHGLFTVRGIQDHFTVMGDRIDWFHFNMSDRIDSEEVARNIIDIESDIEQIFMETEGDFLDKTDGNAPLRDRTKAINDALNKQIPEYKAKFKNYQMSPVQISKSKVR